MKAIEGLRIVPSFEQCMLLGNDSLDGWRLSDFWKALLAPKPNELSNRRRAMALVVVVSVGVDCHTPLSNLVTEIDPTTQLLGAIHNDLVPGRVMASISLRSPSHRI